MIRVTPSFERFARGPMWVPPMGMESAGRAWILVATTDGLFGEPYVVTRWIGIDDAGRGSGVVHLPERHPEIAATIHARGRPKSTRLGVRA